jgi:hypothetical protein
MYARKLTLLLCVLFLSATEYNHGWRIEYNCAHHVTWSPNKFWRFISIFYLWNKASEQQAEAFLFKQRQCKGGGGAKSSDTDNGPSEHFIVPGILQTTRNFILSELIARYRCLLSSLTTNEGEEKATHVNWKKGRLSVVSMNLPLLCVNKHVTIVPRRRKGFTSYSY